MYFYVSQKWIQCTYIEYIFSTYPDWNKLLVDVSIVIHRNIYKITYFSNEFLSWGTKNKGQHYPTAEAQPLHVLTESKHCRDSDFTHCPLLLSFTTMFTMMGLAKLFFFINNLFYFIVSINKKTFIPWNRPKLAW